MELCLSRAEAKRLVSKLKDDKKEHVNYRALTDVEVGAPEKVTKWTGCICAVHGHKKKENIFK